MARIRDKYGSDQMSGQGQKATSDRERARSALPSRTDISFGDYGVCFVPIVLKKSFLGDDQKFSGLLMRFARGGMRDHIVSHKNDH
jgi:hypothetical protein